MKLIPDLREFIELLNSESVQYVVIGGWAYNRYAEPRFTGDFDVFVGEALDNHAAVRRVLQRFGFGDFIPPPETPLFTKKIIMLGRPPSRIDLISCIDGVGFDEAWNNRQSGTLDNLPVYFLSKSLLIKNKRSAGRDKDLLDVKTLERS